MTVRHSELKPLADTMRTFRKATGYAQEAFAHEVNLDRGFVGAIERAERNVGYRKIQQLLVGLGITWADFGLALHERDPLPITGRVNPLCATGRKITPPSVMPSAIALAPANEQLRAAAKRRNAAAFDLAGALIKHLLADRAFARATIRVAENLLPCTLSTQLKTIARGDTWTPICADLARDRRLLQLVTESQSLRELALRDLEIASHIVRYSAAKKGVNEAAMQLRRLATATKRLAESPGPGTAV